MQEEFCEFACFDVNLSVRLVGLGNVAIDYDMADMDSLRLKLACNDLAECAKPKLANR
jgi:hypothetical protein